MRQSKGGGHVAYIGLGANLGQREKSITAALNALERTRGIVVEAVSSLYQTDPVGGPPGQPEFLNAVARLRTELSPQRLLAVLLNVEHSLGRHRGERWGPRTIDLDILLYDDLVLSEDGLTIPHPLMHERRFVMEPLAEIAADVVHPTLQLTARDILKSIGDLSLD
jgi:2-amino-4-hydroxy-6-hydroxymethyldihydropteridine diphosphokinase